MGKIKLFKRVCLLQISKIKSISTVNKTILCLKFRNNKTPTKISKSFPALKVKVHPKDIRQTKPITADSEVECRSSSRLSLAKLSLSMQKLQTASKT